MEIKLLPQLTQYTPACRQALHLATNKHVSVYYSAIILFNKPYVTLHDVLHSSGTKPGIGMQPDHRTVHCGCGLARLQVYSRKRTKHKACGRAWHDRPKRRN